MDIEWEIGSVSDAGKKRGDSPNQDVIKILPPEESRGKPLLLIVADGMGGYKGGEIASQLVVKTICDSYTQSDSVEDYSLLLGDCVVAAHKAVQDFGKSNPELASMGSTVVVVALDGENIWLANVGDSRAYLINGEKIELVSYDHSVVADYVRSGLLNALEALHHPNRNKLTQSINVKRASIKPFLAKKAFSKDDIVLLCTDGLWGVVSDSVIQAVALEYSSQPAAEKLVSLTYTSRAPDNVSVVIAKQLVKSEIGKAVENDETDPGL